LRISLLSIYVFLPCASLAITYVAVVGAFFSSGYCYWSWWEADICGLRDGVTFEGC